jgi:hypothetical protein
MPTCCSDRLCSCVRCCTSSDSGQKLLLLLLLLPLLPLLPLLLLLLEEML